MSTCPDKIIYSEYLDGELPSPWKEKLETHIEKCKGCDSTLRKFSTISEAMHSDDSCSRFDCDASYERLKTKFKQGHTTDVSDSRSPAFWKSTVKLPLPVIAAAALTLVLLPTVFFMLKGSSAGKQQFFAQTYPTLLNSSKTNYSASEISNPGIKAGEFSSSISEFMRMYMPSSSDSAELIIIKIPTSKLNSVNDNVYLKSLLSDEKDTVKTKEPSE